MSSSPNTTTTSPPDEDADTTHNLQPIALLVDELKSDQLQTRLNAYKKLPIISLALGPERTRIELVPFLQSILPSSHHYRYYYYSHYFIDSISSEEDEIVAELANQIQDNFVLECLGGSSHAFLLIPIIEILLSADESIIRQNTIDSLQKIITLVGTEEFVVEFILSMVKRLSEGDWFSRKCSAASVIGFIITFIKDDEKRKEMFLILSKLCKEDSASVRRASVMSLTRVIESSTNVEAIDALLPILEVVSNDVQVEK